jgi:xanthine dehydrogenase accessory factor
MKHSSHYNKNTVLLWKYLAERLLAGERVLLYIVVDTSGSSPGRPGFKMLVTEAGKFLGTIGGGLLEHDLQKSARMFFEDANFKPHLIHKLHTDVENEQNMICGGKQSIYVTIFSHSDTQKINTIINVFKNGSGYINIDQNGFSYINDLSIKENIFFIQKNKFWIYRERIPQIKTIYIIGGGHIGLALYKQMKLLGFKLFIFDNRTELTSPEMNPLADKIKIVDYVKIEQYLEAGRDSYVVIATAAHTHDHLVLKKLIRLPFQYIGMLGSKTKVAQVFQKLSDTGFSQNELDKIHAPIGLSIKSQTPEEIAVSIAAQIIQISNT